MIKFTINVETNIQYNLMKIPDFKNANFNGFRDSLYVIDWEETLTGNANTMFDTFLHKFKEIEKHFIQVIPLTIYHNQNFTKETIKHNGYTFRSAICD